MKYDKPKLDVYAGVRWSAASRYGAQGVQVLVSLVLARLLAPEYFGLLSMATVITGFAAVFKNLGFSTVIIQRKELTDELLSTLFWVTLALCILTTAVVFAVAPVTAWIYRDERVTPIVAVLSINFLLSGFDMVPRSLLQRQMAFNSLAIREISAVAVEGATSMTLAILGWGVWALVLGSLTGHTAQILLVNIVCPFRPRFAFDRLGLRECLGFGLNLTGHSIFDFFARNADNLIIGIFLGPVALGYYALAYKLVLLPRDSINKVVERVLLPAFSRMQDDEQRLANAYLRSRAAIALVAFPMMLGIAVIARPFTDVVLGTKWLPAVPLFYVLAPLGALQSIWDVACILLAKGRADLHLRLGVAGGIVFVCSFFAGLPWGITGVAFSYALACLFWVLVVWRMAFKLVEGLTVRRLIRTVAPYAMLSILMATMVLICEAGLECLDCPTSLKLGICVPVGIVTYTVGVLIVHVPVLEDVVRLIPQPIAAASIRYSTRRRDPR